MLYVTKQEKTNGKTYPHLSAECVAKDFVKKVTEKPKTALAFEDINALDHIFYIDKMIFEKLSLNNDIDFNDNFDNLIGMLKFEYIGLRTHASEILNFDNRFITCSPRKPRMLTENKLIFLTLLDETKRKDGSKIIGRARTRGYQEGNVTTPEMINNCPKLSHFKYFVELYDIEVIDDSIDNGISLHEIVEKFQLSMFPGTKAQNPYKAYAQQSYREISDEAKNYINELLNKRKLKKLV